MIIEGFDCIFREKLNDKLVEIYTSDNMYYDDIEIYIDNKLYLKTSSPSKDSFITCVKLIPEGAIVLTQEETAKYQGKLLAGTLQGAHKIVYGLPEQLVGCNFFWIPTIGELDKILVKG